jgi:hypothetical protein
MNLDEKALAKERYAHVNRQLLEVTTYLLGQMKSGHTTPEMASEVIDELLNLIGVVTHYGVPDDMLRSKSVATEVLVFAERVLPDYA